jgi:hypothetical protein
VSGRHPKTLNDSGHSTANAKPTAVGRVEVTVLTNVERGEATAAISVKEPEPGDRRSRINVLAKACLF